MRLPRSVSAHDLIKALRSPKFGYAVTRQTGSHIRLTSLLSGEHHITVPNHDPIKIGTLAAILTEIAIHHKVDKNDIISLLN